jgi:Tol biopolymer transport system component
MKKTFLLLAASVMCIILQAQVLEIVSMQKVATPQGMEAKVAGISPMGDYILLTSDVNSGLMRYDIATGAINTISKADGAGWSVKISADGQNIVYRERYFDANQLSKHNVFEYNMASGDKAVVAKNQRYMTTLVHANHANSVTINEDLHMVLVHNGKNIVLAPN